MLTDFEALGAELARVSNTRRVGRVTAVGHGGARDRRTVEPCAHRRPGGDRARRPGGAGVGRGGRRRLGVGGPGDDLRAARRRGGRRCGDAARAGGRSSGGELGRADRRRLRPAPRRAAADAGCCERDAAPGAAAAGDAQGAREPARRLGSPCSTLRCRWPAGSGSGSSPASGVGKSSLLADLARGIEAEIVVYALIGERGRELRDFVDNVLGPEGMERAVVIAATSDQAPLIKRRAAWMAMAVAEVFRDQGRHVLLLIELADALCRGASRDRADGGRGAVAARLSAVGREPDRGPLRAGGAGAIRQGRYHGDLQRAGRRLGHGRADRRHHAGRSRWAHRA